MENEEIILISNEPELEEMTSTQEFFNVNTKVQPNIFKKSIEEVLSEVFDKEVVKINCGGRIFETYVATFLKFPSTLLGTMFNERNKDLIKTNEMGCYFFDRNPVCFEVILDWYRSGVLFVPDKMHPELLKKGI